MQVHVHVFDQGKEKKFVMSIMALQLRATVYNYAQVPLITNEADLLNNCSLSLLSLSFCV